MMRTAVFALALALTSGAPGASAQMLDNNPALIRVRYIVNDVPAAADIYANKLGFKVEMLAGRNFAALSRGNVQLLLSPVKGPGGASQPMPDGRRPAPGGWTRIVLYVPDLQSEVDRLRKDGVQFRSEIIVGLGGSEILLDDPSGNPVELFQPG